MLNISGEIIHVYPEKTGIGKKGKWIKEQLVVRIDQSKYHNKLGIWVWNYNIGKFKVGDIISADISVEGLEFNGKYITEITAYKVSKLMGSDS